MVLIMKFPKRKGTVLILRSLAEMFVFPSSINIIKIIYVQLQIFKSRCYDSLCECISFHVFTLLKSDIKNFLVIIKIWSFVPSRHKLFLNYRKNNF
jgi:hypothetical protein